MIAIDVNDGQLELAASMGADLTINSRNEDAAKVIQKNRRRPRCGSNRGG